MHRPPSPLPIRGRMRADTIPVDDFLASINRRHCSAGITRFDGVFRVVQSLEADLRKRGAALELLDGARILYRPAIPERRSPLGAIGRSNSTWIETTRSGGTWFLTGAMPCQCDFFTPAAVHHVLPPAAVAAILAQAVRDISLAPDASTQIDIRALMSEAPELRETERT